MFPALFTPASACTATASSLLVVSTVIGGKRTLRNHENSPSSAWTSIPERQQKPPSLLAQSPPVLGGAGLTESALVEALTAAPAPLLTRSIGNHCLNGR